MRCHVVLITGGSEGIGAACASTFLQQGSCVSVCDIRVPLERREDSNFLFIRGDVTDPGIREHAIDRTLAQFGRIDVLINCAGVGLYSTASNTPLDLAARMFDVNVMASVGMAQQVAPVMRAQGSGAIVNLGSIGGEVTLPWSALYCATKSAVHAVSEALHRELKSDNIHVMMVIPGVVDTNFRFNVLAGSPPPRVETMKSLPALKVADEILRGLASRRRTVWIPRLGYPFDLLNRFFPQLVDRYCAIKQRGWSEPRAERSQSECG